MAVDDRLFDFGDVAGRRKFRRVVDFDHFAVGGGDAIAHAGRGGDQIDVELALQALLHDFQVQQAEEAAAETEAQRDGIFRLVEECGVVQLQFSERVAQQLRTRGDCTGYSPAKTMGLMASKPGSGGGRARRIGDGVADVRVGHALDIGDDEADVAGGQFVEHDGLGRERAEAFHLVTLRCWTTEANLLCGRDAAVHHAHQNDGAAIGIEPGIENQRAQRRVGRAFRRRNARHDGFENVSPRRCRFLR